MDSNVSRRLPLFLISLHHAANKGLTVIDGVTPLIYSDNLGVPNFNLDIPERLPIIEALSKVKHLYLMVKKVHSNHVQTLEDIQSRDLDEEAGRGASPIYWLMTKVGLMRLLQITTITPMPSLRP